jgi:hypothetical protein
MKLAYSRHILLKCLYQVRRDIHDLHIDIDSEDRLRTTLYNEGNLTPLPILIILYPYILTPGMSGIAQIQITVEPLI